MAGDWEVTIGPRVTARVRPYERGRDDPLHRPLRIFTLDPAASRLDGAVALVKVPYEPLAPGPTGRLFRVDAEDGNRRMPYRQVDLDDPGNLLRLGRTPSTTDPEFHQQMVYAVCSLVYAQFRRALGRDVAWSLPAAAGERPSLILRPFGGRMRNAYYDPAEGSLVFGYFSAEDPGGGGPHRGTVFTSLSHDIVAHEVTHAILDGLRAKFTVPTGADVLAFHEAFADLIALFMHFTYPGVVDAAIRSSGADIAASGLLLGLARQFGEANGRNGPLRLALEDMARSAEPSPLHEAGDEPHRRGAVLVGAVFEAFVTVYRRKAERYAKLAGRPLDAPPHDMSAELLSILAEEACQLAGQFLAICIRAVDYCPPVDIELGEFLRAVVTADRELVPEDDYAYREAWIRAFRRRAIYPPDVMDLSEDALLWRGPERPLPDADELSFRRLQFDGDPARAADEAELLRQATALGRFLSQAEVFAACGLVVPGDPRLNGDWVDPPVVESIRSSRRIGPDGQVLFDLVAEISQTRHVRRFGGMPFLGGATLIFGPRGEVRYIVAKNIVSERRLAAQAGFMSGDEGARFWRRDPDGSSPSPRLFGLCHDRGM